MMCIILFKISIITSYFGGIIQIHAENYPEGVKTKIIHRKLPFLKWHTDLAGNHRQTGGTLSDPFGSNDIMTSSS